MTSPTAVARSPLHAWHAAHGARFVTRDGWLVPASYESAERPIAPPEVGMTDLSSWAKTTLLGPGVAEVVSSLRVGAERPGQVAGADLGGPVLVCRLTDDLLLIVAESPTASFHGHLRRWSDGGPVQRFDASTAHACFGLTGPGVDSVLRRLTALDLTTALPPGGCAETGLAGVPALLVRPPNAVRPVLYVLVGWDLAEYVWDRLLAAGAEPVGWETREQGDGAITSWSSPPRPGAAGP